LLLLRIFEYASSDIKFSRVIFPVVAFMCSLQSWF
jgi:hypothetical protein